MACEAWGAATMIGGLFIYNHKGEVLISRVYRDDIGWVLWVKLVQATATDFSVVVISFQHFNWDMFGVFLCLKIYLCKIRSWKSVTSVLGDHSSVNLTVIGLIWCWLFRELFHGYQLYCSHTEQLSCCSSDTGRSTGSADQKRSCICFWFSCFSVFFLFFFPPMSTDSTD